MSDAEITVKKASFAIPMVTGEKCEHGRDVAFNLAVPGRFWPSLAGIVVHLDDDTDCDGQLVIHGETGWR